MNKSEINSEYGKSGPIPFPYFNRNSHNIRWAPGDWTDDTDQLICKEIPFLLMKSNNGNNT